MFRERHPGGIQTGYQEKIGIAGKDEDRERKTL